ncbi:MAG TPA: hypothetical protein PLU80_19670, partial [Acidobacteriota bacterium]|nr:hypothetical protein [Acidobacteriota bacterium]
FNLFIFPPPGDIFLRHRHLDYIYIILYTGFLELWHLSWVDLSQKKQLLDIVIIRRTDGQWDHPLPDGFDNLADHNLISYKSLREPFDDWTLKELTGHYVNYRKQVSPSLNDLLPEDRFRLYGICTRFPSHLTSQVDMRRVLGGVYDIYRGSDRIRLIVLSEIQDAGQNLIWELFSTRPDQIRVAAQKFQARYGEASTILNQLLRYYQLGCQRRVSQNPDP